MTHPRGGARVCRCPYAGETSSLGVTPAFPRDLDSEFPQDAPHEVDCEEGLDAEVGESTSCEVEDANGAGTIVVEIVQVDGNEIEYEAEFSDYNLHNGEDDLDTEDETEGEDEG